MKVAFVVNDLQLSGGVGVVVEHARQLVRATASTSTSCSRASSDEPDWGFPGLGDVPVHGMERARGERYDVAVATWWETVGPTLELPTRTATPTSCSRSRTASTCRTRRSGWPRRSPTTCRCEIITEARWIAETLEALMPERRCLLVRNGIAKDVFAPVDAPPIRGDEPLRILIEGNPGVVVQGRQRGAGGRPARCARRAS